MPSLLRITSVRVLGDRRVRVTLTNGETRELDLAPLLRGPAFEALRTDEEVFARVRVDQEFGTLVWPSGADLCPDVLLYGMEPA